MVTIHVHTASYFVFESSLAELLRNEIVARKDLFALAPDVIWYHHLSCLCLWIYYFHWMDYLYHLVIHFAAESRKTRLQWKSISDRLCHSIHTSISRVPNQWPKSHNIYLSSWENDRSPKWLKVGQYSAPWFHWLPIYTLDNRILSQFDSFPLWLPRQWLWLSYQ